MLPAKGKPKKFQGYDHVVYKQIKRFIAQNVVAMDLCLKAYEDEGCWRQENQKVYCTKCGGNGPLFESICF